MPGAQVRRALRRTDIVTAAAAQFAESGYPAVGMDQIGAAAGITGPAIYRHFDSKSAILAAVFDGIIDAVTVSPELPDDAPPELELAALVTVYAAAVASRRRLMTVFVREVHHLPPEQRSGLDTRQRALIRRWRVLLAGVHPEWSEERVRTAVHGCFGLLNSVGTFDSPWSDGELAAELVTIGRRALGLEGDQGPGPVAPDPDQG